jgi:hypothetical protein
MERLFTSIVEPILLTLMIAVGGGVYAFFRRVSKTQQDLCDKVTMLQKTLIILAKAVDRQSNRLHPEANSELDELVKELLHK